MCYTMISFEKCLFVPVKGFIVFHTFPSKGMHTCVTGSPSKALWLSSTCRAWARMLFLVEIISLVCFVMASTSSQHLCCGGTNQRAMMSERKKRLSPWQTIATGFRKPDGVQVCLWPPFDHCACKEHRCNVENLLKTSKKISTLTFF